MAERPDSESPAPAFDYGALKAAVANDLGPLLGGPPVSAPVEPPEVIHLTPVADPEHGSLAARFGAILAAGVIGVAAGLVLSRASAPEPSAGVQAWPVVPFAAEQSG